MRAIGMREMESEWWETPTRSQRSRGRREWRGWRATGTRPALLLEGALLVFCLFVATVSQEESAEIFAILAMVGTPFVVMATLAYLVFRRITSSVPRRSYAADYECRCAPEADDVRPVLPRSAELSGEQRLRRRYVAGELSESEFQLGMIVLAKERFTQGHLSLSEYEVQLDRLLERARAAAVLGAEAAAPTKAAAAAPPGGLVAGEAAAPLS